MQNLRKYGILKEKGRPHENIAYTLALIYNICEKKISDLLSKYNLSVAQYNVLLATRYQNDGQGINQVEIGSHLIVSPSGITKIINKLRKENFLEVSQNKTNRRENIVKITPKGSDLIDEVWPEYDKAISNIANFIPKENQNNLSSILNDWFKKLREDNHE